MGSVPRSDVRDRGTKAGAAYAYVRPTQDDSGALCAVCIISACFSIESFAYESRSFLYILGGFLVAASRKSKKFWIWLIAGRWFWLLLVAGVGLARLRQGHVHRSQPAGQGDARRCGAFRCGHRARFSPSPRSRSRARLRALWKSSMWISITWSTKGQQLAQLDQQEIAAQVEAQRAQLAAAEANVSTYEANIEQDKVNAAAPDLPMYKATLDRNLEMQKEGIVSRQALDDANRDYLAALTRRDTSKAQIGVDTAKLKQARAQVMQSQASLKQLEEQLSYTTIVAPDGWRDPVARRGDWRCGQLHPGAGLDGHAGDDRGRHQRGLRAGQGGRGRHCARLYGPAGAHQGGELPRPRLSGQGDQDFADGRGKGQCDHVRGSGLHQQPRRRVEGAT